MMKNDARKRTKKTTKKRPHRASVSLYTWPGGGTESAILNLLPRCCMPLLIVACWCLPAAAVATACC
jgi:hypothetical protein